MDDDGGQRSQGHLPRLPAPMVVRARSLRATEGRGIVGRAVEVDLAEVTFMDSTGLTTLMDAHFAAENNGWSFKIRRPSRAVRRVFAESA